MNFLSDHFYRHGSSLTEFYEELEKIADNTRIRKVTANQLEVLSVNDEKSDNNNIVCNRHVFEEYANYVDSFNVCLDRKTILGDDIDLQDDVYHHSKTMFALYDENKYAIKTFLPTSLMMLPTLGMRLGLGSAIQTPSIERDKFIARLMGEMGEKKITLVSHVDEENEKIFAVLSDEYTYIPQTIIRSIISNIEKDGKLGKPECVGWYIDNEFTQVNLVFPEYAEDIKDTYNMLPHNIIPGIQIMSSDMAKCALFVRGVWYKTHAGGGYIIQNEVSKTHKGEVDLTDIQKRIEASIFDEYTKLPEQLIDLMKVNVTEKTAKPKENQKSIQECIKKVFKEMELTKIIGKKNEVLLREYFLSEIDETISYTAYDIAMMIVELPDRIDGITTATRNRFAKACNKAIYYDYSEHDVTIALSV